MTRSVGLVKVRKPFVEMNTSSIQPTFQALRHLDIKVNPRIHNINQSTLRQRNRRLDLGLSHNLHALISLERSNRVRNPRHLRLQKSRRQRDLLPFHRPVCDSKGKVRIPPERHQLPTREHRVLREKQGVYRPLLFPLLGFRRVSNLDREYVDVFHPNIAHLELSGDPGPAESGTHHSGFVRVHVFRDLFFAYEVTERGLDGGDSSGASDEDEGRDRVLSENMVS